MALKGQINIDSREIRVNVTYIVDKISAYLKKNYPDNTDLDTVIAAMPELQVGLDVNFNLKEYICYQ